MVKQPDELINLILQAATSELVSGYDQNYKVYILPKDFHPVASQIRYFALVDNEKRIVGLSEEVPEKFRDIWIRHEIECGLAEYEACYSITLIEIADAKETLQHAEYREFLEKRTELYSTLVEAVPDHPAILNLQTSLHFFQTAMKNGG